MNAHSVGGAGLIRTAAGLRFYLPASFSHYANAQIDDHTGLRRRAFPWRPATNAVTLTLRARFSHEAATLRGTAGFGFWNDPFSMGGTWPPALPQAAWFFFAGADSNLPLAHGVPGWGWKAATIDAGRAQSLALLPVAPLGPLLLRSPAFERALWPRAQRALGIAERLVGGSMTAWRDYRIEWRAHSLTFSVDGAPLLQSEHAPRGPLGLVIWMDAQYLVATPQGRLRAGTVRLDAPQWMEIAELAIEA